MLHSRRKIPLLMDKPTKYCWPNALSRRLKHHFWLLKHQFGWRFSGGFQGLVTQGLVNVLIWTSPKYWEYFISNRYGWRWSSKSPKRDLLLAWIRPSNKQTSREHPLQENALWQAMHVLTFVRRRTDEWRDPHSRENPEKSLTNMGKYGKIIYRWVTTWAFPISQYIYIYVYIYIYLNGYMFAGLCENPSSLIYPP